MSSHLDRATHTRCSLAHLLLSALIATATSFLVLAPLRPRAARSPPPIPVAPMAGPVSVTGVQVDDRTDRYTVSTAQSRLAFRDFFAKLADAADPALRTALAAALRDSRFPAFYFETPPFSRASIRSPFEFVLVSAPDFVGMQADPSAFRNVIGAPPAGRPDVAIFDNLGGDARLIAPVQVAGVMEAKYAHVAPFVRGAPREQVDRLWRSVGRVAMECVEDGRVHWLSTAGGGVPWLHVRFDLRPKYYTHRPYREAAVE
jgi:hypothetical protein